MKSLALRWTTFGLFVAVLIAAAYLLWRHRRPLHALPSHPLTILIVDRRSLTAAP